LLQILERRNRGIDIVIAPARVQGANSAAEIADAIRLLNQYSKQSGCEVDVMIIARGGGSIEDLWAFNEEHVARAIAASEIPIVSAVGHETDYTIADFVADLRAPTPSAAAEIVAADSAEVISRIDHLQAGLRRAIRYDLLRRRARLAALIDRPGFTDTAHAVVSLADRRRELERRTAQALGENLRQARLRLTALQHRLTATDFRAPLILKTARLATLSQRLDRALVGSLDRKQHHLELQASKLNALSPLSVLGRGYALVMDENGRLVPRAANVSPGQDLTLRFEDGEVDCTVKQDRETR
jgi:exodeoxyribonuclease VII large subunit